MSTRVHIRAFSLIGALAVLLGGCFKPPPPPVPTQLHVSRAPSEVVQVAAQLLTLSGFDIAVSDANGGTVVAKRTRSPQDQGRDVVCEYQRGSLAAREATSTLTMNLSARPASSGSDIVMNGVVHVDFGTLDPVFRRAPTDKECVSSGVVEKKIADALRG